MDDSRPFPAGAGESALGTLEQALGVCLTVRDLSGSLGDHALPKARNSHRRQPVCDRGFAPACIAHCRRAINARCRSEAGSFVHTCWKGVREVVLPVRRDGDLLGCVFVGAWQADSSPDGPWRQAWQELPVWDPDRAARIAGAVQLAAAGLFSARSGDAARPGSRAEAIVAWVRANLATGAGRAGLARHLGLSPERTSHAVREACSCSLQELQARERVARACHLLATTDLSVAQVGARVGWGDAPHFSRMFRRLAGASPLRWRREQRVG